MRTMFVANTLVTALNPTVKGALGLINPNGTACDFLVSPTNTNRDAPFTFVNSLGNGSVKTFRLNPYNFNFHSQLSGQAGGVAATDVVPSYAITYPTGNARTDSFGNAFVGGIVVKKFDKDKNVFITKKLLSVEVYGNAGVVLNSDVVIAFKAAMASITGAGNWIASAVHTTTVSSVFTLSDTTTQISLTGDLRNWIMPKTNGESFVVNGIDAVKFERELMPNAGYHAGENDVDLFDRSNFIADPTCVAYDIIVIETKSDTQRQLLPGAINFETRLFIYVPHTAQTLVYDKILAFLVKLKATPSVVV